MCMCEQSKSLDTSSGLTLVCLGFKLQNYVKININIQMLVFLFGRNRLQN